MLKYKEKKKKIPINVITSRPVKPILHTFVLLFGAFNALVNAEADKSFPMDTTLIKNGTIRYSNIFIGSRTEPTPRNFIAS